VLPDAFDICHNCKRHSKPELGNKFTRLAIFSARSVQHLSYVGATPPQASKLSQSRKGRRGNHA